MLTVAQKRELRKLLDKASPGPWEAFQIDRGDYFPRVYLGPPRMHSDGSGEPHRPSVCINESFDPKTTTAGANMPTFQATAKLIAFLRNHAEELLK